MCWEAARLSGSSKGRGRFDMAILADYHLHSSFSGDSETPMEEMVAKGLGLGLEYMCFTEHMDMDYVYSKPEEEGMFELDTASYLSGLARCREKHKGGIDVRFGVELGVQPHIAQKLSAYAGAYDFDFIIASSHLSNRKDPYFPDFYEGRSEEEAYGEYFASILDNLKSFQDFDVYGHLDYVVRYGPQKDAEYSYGKYRDALDPALRWLAEHGKGIEINTGAIGYGLRELNPCTDIIRRYRELGGETVTVGSDAHTPERIAHGFGRAEEVLRSCGFRHYAIFSKRKPEYIRL